MGRDKISILKYLKLNGSRSALDIAKNFCGAERKDYMKWYERLADMQLDGYVRFKKDDAFPNCLTVLTPSGEDALEYEQKSRSNRQVEWIRYGITTFVAVSALVLSAISIAAQLGLLQLPQA